MKRQKEEQRNTYFTTVLTCYTKDQKLNSVIEIGKDYKRSKR